MNHDDREYIAKAINYFWGDGTAAPHTVNQKAASVLYEALQEAQSCSAAMDLVPRPASSKPGLSYVIKQVAKIGKRVAARDTQLYEACRVQVARNYRSAIKLALMGL